MSRTVAVQQDHRERRFKKKLRNYWYRFSRNKLSVLGLLLVVAMIVLATLAPVIAPYPTHVGAFVDFANAKLLPSLEHLFGTDSVGRDIFSRVLFSLQNALLQALLVLGMSVPFGVFLGLTAGFLKNRIADTVIMRIADIFLSIPALILAMAVAAVSSPSMINSTFALSIMWWAWYARIAYSVASSVRNEYYIYSAELIGASRLRIVFTEILPNCMSPVLTKMSLDVGWVILASSILSYVGLGEQPPAPSLGQMVADGKQFIPTYWWILVFPSLTIVVIILGFNLLGDGISDMLTKGDEEA
jgi:peptide/nickel transport system permease protein